MLGLFGGLNGPWEIIAILVVALLLFGKRLPEVARSLGKGIVEFKRGLKGVEDDVRNSDEKPASLPKQNSSSSMLPPSSPGEGSASAASPPQRDESKQRTS